VKVSNTHTHMLLNPDQASERAGTNTNENCFYCF